MTENERIISKLDDLTKQIADLVVTIARKEERDHHIENEVTELAAKQKSNEKRINDIEKIVAGDQARLEIQKWIWKAAVTVTTGLVISGIIWSITQMKGG